MALTMKLFYIAILICVTRVLSEDNNTGSTVAGPTGPSTAASPIAPGIPSDVCDGLNKTECCENATCAFSNCDDETGQAYKCTNASDITESCKHGNKTIDQCKDIDPTGAGATGLSTAAAVSTAGGSSEDPGPSASTAKTVITDQSTSSDEASTEKPDPTTVPPTTSEKTPCHEGQRFDAASFIGGIVLCGGIVVIIFFACKFYKSRSERTYHQF